MGVECMTSEFDILDLPEQKRVVISGRCFPLFLRSPQPMFHPCIYIPVVRSGPSFNHNSVSGSGMSAIGGASSYNYQNYP